MLRIHFTSEDLTRVRLAPAADPLWETLLSLHALGGNYPAIHLRQWRVATLPRLGPGARMLARLAPPTGYSVDFLTPPDGCTDLAEGIDAVLSTPRQRLRADLNELAAQRPLPGWAALLGAGDATTLRGLGHAMNAYYAAALAPHWDVIGGSVDADRSRRAKALTDGGVERLLATLHPTTRWNAPVLEVAYPYDRTLHLGGRGIRLVPSYYCWRMPVTVREAELTPTLVYPIEHDPGQLPGGRPLDSLLGARRAAVLAALATPDGRTTSALARAIGASASTASEHTSVLRDAGLVTSQRDGKHVIHTLTPLGRAILTRSAT
jgi:DNA-binding transcriptional ArsR family regulator